MSTSVEPVIEIAMDMESKRLLPERVAAYAGSTRVVLRDVNHAAVGTRRQVLRDERGAVLQERRRLSDVVHHILAVRRDEDFRALLSGELQNYIRHDILIAARGDFRLGVLHYDLLAADRSIDGLNIGAGGIAPILNQLFQGWVANGRKPLQTNIVEYADAWRAGGIPGKAAPAMSRMKSVLVHGLLDKRGHNDYLYAFFSASPPIRGDETRALELLVPYLDVALRQFAVPPRETGGSRAIGAAAATVEDDPQVPLSEREVEIIGWVAQGKTNAEIADILNLSSFTIKNHMQRIFKKLDVFNRAQAVSVFKSRHGSDS
jgi:transcriptional regulator EpsA